MCRPVFTLASTGMHLGLLPSAVDRVAGAAIAWRGEGGIVTVGAGWGVECGVLVGAGGKGRR